MDGEDGVQPVSRQHPDGRPEQQVSPVYSGEGQRLNPGVEI